MKKLAVLFAPLALLVAVPAFAAAKIEYKAQPATPEEQAVAKVVESFIEAQGGSYSAIAPLLTDDAVACCFTVGFGYSQDRYEGKTKVATFLASAGISGKHASDLHVKVQGDRAEVNGRYDYAVDNPRGRPVERSNLSTWKLRKEADGAWRIYEVAYQRR